MMNQWWLDQLDNQKEEYKMMNQWWLDQLDNQKEQDQWEKHMINYNLIWILKEHKN